MRPTRAALGLALVLLVGWTVARAQSQTPPRPPADIMPALLEEVRGLRTALEQMNTAGPRVQLALGRLQMQEQRMSTAIKRVEDIRTRLSGLQREQAEMQQQLGMMEAAFKEQRSQAGQAGADVEQQIDEVRKHHKQRLTYLGGEVQRLTAEESMYAAEVATEQARWTDFNQRLEDLERALRPLR